MTTRRALLLALALATLLLGGIVVDLARGLRSAGSVDLGVLPAAQDAATTYLLVGSDSRERLSAQERVRYPSPSQERGERADAIVLLEVDGLDVRALDLPRDLVTGATRGDTASLSTRLLNGPGELVSTLCLDLGVRVDHLVLIGFDGLVALVDALGGVEIGVREPVRDRKARLDLPLAGRQLLDGQTALAWVRSREPEVFRDGRWVRTSWAEEGRATHLSEVLTAIAGTRSPLALRAAVHAAGPTLRVDAGLGLWEWAQLGRALVDLGADADGIPVARTAPDAERTSDLVVMAETEIDLQPFHDPACT